MKITPDHLARGAFVYIRQSTADQLANNHESRRRQYDLAERARALGLDGRATAGWPRHTCRTWQRLRRSTLTALGHVRQRPLAPTRISRFAALAA
jgi:hypothetical protein